MAEVDVGGRRVRLTNLDKLYWPRAGWTKARLLEHYAAVADVMVPHIRDHPVTLHRFPDGVRGTNWYETRAPAHPDWIRTVTFSMKSGKVFDVAVLDDAAGLVWAAQIGAVEIHPFLATTAALDRPSAVVFDLDPGRPLGLAQCCEAALWVREVLERFGLISAPKTSGGKGMHVFVPVGQSATYTETKAFARAVAELLDRLHPGAVTPTMSKSQREGKVFVDWSQNDPGKSTIAPYSIRGYDPPTVSTPLTWAEVDAAAGDGNANRLRFTPEEVWQRVEDLGDLFADVLDAEQTLPSALDP